MKKATNTKTNGASSTRKRPRRRRNRRQARTANTHQDRRIRFSMAAYDGKEIIANTITREEALALDLESHDCCLAECLGGFGFRQPVTGKWTRFGQNGHTIGPVCREILEAAQWHPGVRLDPFMLCELTGEENLLDSANVASRTLSLRRAFHETKETEYFILTDGGGLAWPIGLTWISLEPCIPANAENKEPE